MRDNITLSDGKDTIIVNQRSYCELIKWLIVKYTGVSYQEAAACVEQHISFFEGLIMKCTLSNNFSCFPI